MRARDDSTAARPVRRADLAVFLRTHRERLDVAELGIRSRWRRRQPYPTQVEFSQVAGIDRRTYQNLEAGTANPTEVVLSLVATAMRLSMDEAGEMYALAGLVPAQFPLVPPTTRAALIVEAFDPTPAWVVGTDATVVAVNDAMEQLLPGLTEVGNVMTWLFCHDLARRVQVDYEQAARAGIGWLRASRAQARPGSPEADRIDALVADLCSASPLARRLWEQPTAEPIRWRHRLLTPAGIVTVSFATLPLGAGMDGMTAMYQMTVTDPTP